MADCITFEELRRSKGYSTQEELATACEIENVKKIGKIERGVTRSPRKQTIIKISKALKVSQEEVWNCIIYTYNTRVNAIDCRLINQKLNEDDNYNLKYKECIDKFYTIAKDNATCDVEIFHALFGGMVRKKKMGYVEKRALLAAINASIVIVQENLADVLDAVRDLFKSMMGGEPFAACVQIMTLGEKEPPEAASVTTVARDSVSARDRPILVGRPIYGNSINERLFLRNESGPIIIDDFAAEIVSGNETTTSKLAGSKYNSILIINIPNIRPKLRAGTKGSIVKQIATLCVDTIGGFRKDRIDICTQFANELAWRIAAMIYRLTRLAAELEELKNTEQNLDLK